MTADDVITYFQEEYPGKTILRLPEDNPTEIICEIEPASDHPERSVAIAAITASSPHYHNQSVEVYEVLQGKLELHVDGKVINLAEGESFTIQPKQEHSAKGSFTLIRITSTPGWTADDHILVENRS
jgi:mannose-6-phosphate isomerase-like protein (cupin superfamily)